MSLIDLMMKTFAPSGIGGAFGGQTPPPLQNGFEDYGPWGAGGGQLGPGQFPSAPAQPSQDMIAQAVAKAQAGPDPNFQPQQMMTQQPQAQPLQQHSRVPQYSAMLDPNGGLLGKIGRLTGAPTRAEAQAARNGEQLSAGITEVKNRVEQGMSPQKAIMDYLQTPGGQQWLMSPGADPVAELHNYVQATKSADPDTRTVGDSVVQQGADGNYTVKYQAPQSEKDTVQIEKDRSEMKIAAARYKLDLQKYNDEKTQTGVTNDQKERELEFQKARLDNDSKKLGMDLKLGDQSILKTQSDIEQAGKTPIMQDYDRFVKDWHAAHGPEPVPLTSDEYKQKYTKLANGGEKLSPALDKASLEWLDSADTSENQMRAYDQMLQLVEGTDSGWMEAASLPLRNIANSIGLLTPEQSAKMSAQQVFKAMTSDLALGKRGHNVISGEVGLTGNTSDKDLNFLIESVANLWNSPLANKAILILGKAQSRRQALLGHDKVEYARSTGDVIGYGKHKQELIDSTPYFTASEKALLTSMSKQVANDPKATANPAPRSMEAPAAKEAPPATFAPDSPFRERAYEILKQRNPAAAAKLAAQPQANVRNNEQLQLKGQTPGVVTAPRAPAPVQAPAPQATPIPGPNPMQNEAPQGAGGGLTDMMMRFMMGGDGQQAPAPTLGQAPNPGPQIGGQGGQDTSFQQPATPDNFITLQDILKMFSGRQ